MELRMPTFMRKRPWVLAPALLVLGVAFLYPFRSTDVPDQRVLVVTADWRPILGVRVRQIWKNYSIEYESHEEERLTDENGRVNFPRRTARASLLRRVLGPIV